MPSVGMSAGLAILGYLFTYWHTKHAEERKANIERINEQLRDLYGPLLACVTATASAYTAMIQSVQLPQSSGKSASEVFREEVHASPEGPAADVYRHWMTHVLQPLNERAADIIVHRIDLLESNAISAELLELVAHVSANRVVLQRWAQGELDAHSAIPYPDRLLDYITRQFAHMKQRQVQLLGVQFKAKL